MHPARGPLRPMRLSPCLFSMRPVAGGESSSQVAGFTEAWSTLLSPGLPRHVESKAGGPSSPLPEGRSTLRDLGTVAPSSCPERPEDLSIRRVSPSWLPSWLKHMRKSRPHPPPPPEEAWGLTLTEARAQAGSPIRVSPGLEKGRLSRLTEPASYKAGT